METANNTVITVAATVNAPVEKVWEFWTNPKHIANWCSASDEWHVPYADNDAQTGGKFKTRMEAKDGSFGFDFEGVYSHVEDLKTIEYSIADGRHVKITFSEQGNATKVVETFDAESVNPIEMQKNGWQAILDNFKKYTEAN